MRPNFQNLAIAAALGGVVAVALAGALPSRADPAAAAVAIDNFTFNPQSITIKAGTTVTWTNKDDIPHALAATDRSFKSKTLDTEDHYAFTFTTPGTYPYFCSLHPHMTGTIVVEAAN
jgi:plastocyanin